MIGSWQHEQVRSRQQAGQADSIVEGRSHGMPAWGVKLNDDQVWKLVAYIKSLRTPNEADPPS